MMARRLRQISGWSPCATSCLMARLRESKRNSQASRSCLERTRRIRTSPVLLGQRSQDKLAPAELAAEADTIVDGERNHLNKYIASAAQAQEGQRDHDSADGSTGEAKHPKEVPTKLRFASTVTSRMMALRNAPPTTENGYMAVVSYTSSGREWRRKGCRGITRTRHLRQHLHRQHRHLRFQQLQTARSICA